MKYTVTISSFCIVLAMLMSIACSNGGSSVNNSVPRIILLQTTYNFSGVVVNNSTDHIFQIGNNGNANLSVGQISAVAAPYSVPAASDACSHQTLAPLQTCAFEVRFEPTSQGLFESRISIPSNDPNGTARIDLSGEGYGLNAWIKKTSTEQGCIATVGITVTDDMGNILDNNDLDYSTDFFFDVNAVAIPSGNILFDTYETPSPVSVVLAIDTSLSEAGVLDTDIKSAAISFISDLTDVDEAAVCSFNSSLEFEPVADSAFYDMATNRQNLIDHINTLTYGSETRLYDAIYESVNRAADGISTNRHLVVVLSDGVDSNSNRTLNEAIAYAEDNGVAVFTIYYRDPDYGEGDYGDPDILSQLADRTGGQDYDGLTGGLDSVYTRIVNTIRNMFIFELTVPGCAPGPASLDVEVDTGTLYGKDSTTITFP